MVTFGVTKIINAPLKFVYAWCTDFREDDTKLTGSSRIRKIIKRTRESVIYGEAYVGPDGKETGSIYILSLKPPNGRHYHKFGEDAETGDYKLTSLGRKRTKFDAKFHQNFKRGINSPKKETLSKRALDRWGKYILALESDFNSGNPP